MLCGIALFSCQVCVESPLGVVGFGRVGDLGWVGQGIRRGGARVWGLEESGGRDGWGFYFFYYGRTNGQN